MHELALLKELCALAVAAAQEQGASHIHRLELRVGELGGVHPDALRQAFAVVAATAPWQTTELQLDVVPTRCFCSHCAQAFSPLDVIHACPECGAISRQVLQGRDLELVALEVS
jgi:hydrogenase nickel incorporation protein HypA/HybF